MNKNKKYILLILLILLIALVGLLLVKNFDKEDVNSKNKRTNNVVNEDTEQKFLLEGYPIEEVPLYKLTKISSNKYIVGMDPSITSPFMRRTLTTTM